MALPFCKRRLCPRPTIRPSITSTDPIGMPPSRRPSSASAMAARRNGSSSDVSKVASLHQLNLDVAEHDRRPLGLQEDVPLGRLGVRAGVDVMTVDDRFDRVALAGDLVLVPLARRLLDLRADDLVLVPAAA